MQIRANIDINPNSILTCAGEKSSCSFLNVSATQGYYCTLFKEVLPKSNLSQYPRLSVCISAEDKEQLVRKMFDY